MVSNIPLVNNKIYKVIINKHEAIFKVIDDVLKSMNLNLYKIHVINSGGIPDNGLFYYHGVIKDINTNTTINTNDTSFQLSVQE